MYLPNSLSRYSYNAHICRVIADLRCTVGNPSGHILLITLFISGYGLQLRLMQVFCDFRATLSLLSLLSIPIGVLAEL
jgi:hypothetical protein